MTAPEAAMGAAAAPDLGQLAAMALRVWGYKQGEVVSLMILSVTGSGCTRRSGTPGR